MRDSALCRSGHFLYTRHTLAGPERRPPEEKPAMDYRPFV